MNAWRHRTVVKIAEENSNTTIKMDNVSITGDVGGDINVTSSFQVADTDYLTEFTKVSLFSVCPRGSADLFADPDHRGLL